MTRKILFAVIPWFVTFLLLQTPVFAHHKGWHKNGPPKHAHDKHAKQHKHHHKHGDQDGHGKNTEHQHEHNDRNSVVKIDLPDPQILKPEVCVKGICLSAK